MKKTTSDPAPSIPIPDWASLTCSLVWIYDHAVPAFGYRRPGVVNQESACWLIREGRAIIKTRSTTLELEPGEWFFLPHEEFWQDFSPGTRLLSIRFRATWVTGIPLFAHGEGIRLESSEYANMELKAMPLLDYFEKELSVTSEYLRAIKATTGQYMKLQVLLMDWLDVYASTLTSLGMSPARLNPMDPRMLQVARELNNWPLEKPLNEDELASHVNLSSRQLSRLFQADFGKTPSRYYTERKLESAKGALESHDKTIKEVAFALGFKSLSHFSTWFRNLCAHSPREYRQAFDKHYPG